ncbi:MAG TPA: hypothetical protein P5079_01225 [Elusimicrobiota bacterium]|nr:hypothetical protein [Elusimicrobiota bacterium]
MRPLNPFRTPPAKTPPDPRSEERFRRILWLHRLIILVLLAALGYLRAPALMEWDRENFDLLRLSRVNQKAPHYKEIKKIIENLRYSGLPRLLRPDVRLELNFEKKMWRLANIHRYTDDGEILLEDGKVGLCGQLATHTYFRIRHLFDHRYSIRFGRVSETNFFTAPEASHIVLQITDLSNPQQPAFYILDPSFRRYGPIEEFGDYNFLEDMGLLAFLTKRPPHETKPVNVSTPILITKNKLLLFHAATRNGRFDKDQFSLMVTALQRHQYRPEPLMTLRVENGAPALVENEGLAGELLTTKKRAALRDMLWRFYRHVEEQTGGKAAVGAGKPTSAK